MSYQPFNKEWERDMKKMSKKQLEIAFSFSGEGLNKMQLIEMIRANLIVKQFNEKYPIGTSLYYMPIADDSSSAKSFTVKSQAFILNGLAVAYFNERPACQSIEPSHIFS
jgi:hypothetical protein